MNRASGAVNADMEHRAKKWEPVFRKNDAATKALQMVAAR